ncbi:MAG: DUF3365 domain-containing protein [Cyanobacteria bacterium P01_F01_bin.150]
MSIYLSQWLKAIRTRMVAFIAIVLAVATVAVACSSPSANKAAVGGVGIAPELVSDYIFTVLAADRTAYTKHVVGRSKKLEGKVKEKGVLDIEATEGWKDTDGIPLPAQMFRLGSEIANESGYFTYNLISPWYINDNHAPKGEFEEVALKTMIETGEPFKDYQEVGDQKFFSAMYPDKAVAEACVTCHNTHPIHLERYPDKEFVMDEVMGGVVINIPLSGA